MRWESRSATPRSTRRERSTKRCSWFSDFADGPDGLRRADRPRQDGTYTWVLPPTSLPDRRYVAASASDALARGRQGAILAYCVEPGPREARRLAEDLGPRRVAFG